MNTSDILNKAADLIEQRGWTQGSGWVTHYDSADAPLCLEGGIMAALGQVDTFGTVGFLTCPAYLAVKRYLGDRCRNAVLNYDNAELWAWNDTVAKTPTDVIEVLRAAAVIEAAKENQSTAAPEAATK